MEELVGEWHYSGTSQGVDEDVWIAFSANGEFEMYQKIGTGAHWHTVGTYSYDKEDNILSGVYSDKYPWRYDYSVNVTESSMVLKAVQLDNYSVTYKRESIPAEVRQKALELTKAGEGFVPFL